VSAAVRAVIALGSNQQDPQEQVRRAFDEIAVLPQSRLLARSNVYRTAPVGYPDQPDFVNACALIETSLPARVLLEHLLAIERAHGRVREIRNGPRTLDLDIVVYGDERIDEPGLVVPHPRAHQRMFVIQPLTDVWPDARLGDQGTAAQLLARLEAGKAT
jgi:2-amino-4-hydroxy-6-hydroxymethyldihydropteridine diphosphokinase